MISFLLNMGLTPQTNCWTCPPSSTSTSELIRLYLLLVPRLHGVTLAQAAGRRHFVSPVRHVEDPAAAQLKQTRGMLAGSGPPWSFWAPAATHHLLDHVPVTHQLRRISSLSPGVLQTPDEVFLQQLSDLKGLETLGLCWTSRVQLCVVGM